MNKAEFKKAVADSEAPTPGYLFRDLASWTFTDYATQAQLIKALFDKLHTKNSAFVLYKALHLIAVLCETGHEGFQRELQLSTYTNTLKDFTTYRGPLDVKYGDSWNEKVRREAEAALQAVFHTRVASATTAAAAQAGPSAIEGRSGGDWSGAGASPAPAAGASAAVTGWGSCLSAVLPAFSGASGGSDATRAPSTDGGGGFDASALRVAEMPAENRWAQHQRDLRAAGGAGTSGGITGGSAAAGGKTLLQQLASTARSGVSLVTQFELLKTTQQQLYGDQFGQAARISAGTARRSGTGVDEVGGYQPVGLQVPVAEAHKEQTPPLERAWSSAAPSPPPQQAPQPTQQSSAFNLFEDTRAPSPEVLEGGDSSLASVVLPFARLAQTPSRVELSRFVRAAEDAVGARRPPGEDGCDGGAALGQALSAHLSGERPWQERLNTLACLEAALRTAAPPLRDALERFFTAQPHAVLRNCDVVQASLREKAMRVAQLLHVSPGSNAVPRAAVDTPVDAGGAFAGMTLRPGGSAHRRVGGVAASPRVDAAERAMPSPPGEGSSTAAGGGGIGGGGIRVLRSSAAFQARGTPVSTSAPANGRALDDILGAPAQPRPAPARATLDDLFGDGGQSHAPPHASPAAATPFSADDLFATAPASSAPPLLQQPSAAAPSASTETSTLARIQTLMQYLGTHYDPTAMAELEALIAQRQQEQRRAYPAGVGAPAEGAVVHRHFQTGDGGGGNASAARPSQSHVFAEVQDEMKRQLDL